MRGSCGDATFAGKAGAGTLVFTEPQIRSWYRPRLMTLEPLNGQARQSMDGRSSLFLRHYQKLVKARYADRLPGPTYDITRISRGYGTAEEGERRPLLRAPLPTRRYPLNPHRQTDNPQASGLRVGCRCGWSV